MCHRSQIFGAILFSVGAGFILSCLLEGIVIKIVIGAVLVFLGLTACK